MAEALTVAGIALRVVRDSWSEPEMTYQGARMVMSEGNTVSTEYAGKRTAECQVWFVDSVEEHTFRSAVPRGVAVTVSGELPDDTYSALVDIGQMQKQRKVLPGVGDSIVRVVTLQFEEAEPA